MPVQSTVTLDGVAYAPRGTQNGVSTWANSNDTTFGGGITTVTESVRGPLADGNFRVRFVLTIPKLAEADSPCGCAGTTQGVGKADIVVDIPAAYTAAHRADLCDRIQALVADAVFTAAIDNREGSWG